MKATTLLRRLVRNDARLIFRDPMVSLLLAVSVLAGVLARFALPAIDASLAEGGVMPSAEGGMRFSDTFPLWVAYFGLWNSGQLPGTAFAFLLLDEKEDQTLLAMRVTPLPFHRYLAWRLALPFVLAVVAALLVVPLIGLAPLPVAQLLPMALCGALTAPIVALTLAMFADNKVQGFAYTKFVGVAGLLVLVSWFVPLPWQWLGALFPPFLVCKACWMALAGDPRWWWPLPLSAALQLGLLALLLRRARRTALR